MGCTGAVKGEPPLPSHLRGIDTSAREKNSRKRLWEETPTNWTRTRRCKRPSALELSWSRTPTLAMNPHRVKATIGDGTAKATAAILTALLVDALAFPAGPHAEGCRSWGRRPAFPAATATGPTGGTVRAPVDPGGTVCSPWATQTGCESALRWLRRTCSVATLTVRSATLAATANSCEQESLTEPRS